MANVLADELNHTAALAAESVEAIIGDGDISADVRLSRQMGIIGAVIETARTDAERRLVMAAAYETMRRMDAATRRG